MKKPIDKKPIDKTLKIETTVNIPSIINLAIDKIGAKEVLNVLLSQCLWDTLEKTQFPSCLLANKEDEETAQVTAVLYYAVKGPWKQLADKGTKMLAKKVKEANERKNQT